MNPIAFAMDVPTMGEVQHLGKALRGVVGTFKVGLEVFIANGPVVVKFLPDVILDLKLHDIPETVERAVKSAGDLGVKYMTLHIQQRKALEKAVKAAEPFGMTLLGVTVLTSMTVEDFKDLDWDWDQEGELRGTTAMEYRVRKLAQFGASCGLKGFVCSPQEVESLRERHPEAFLLVPGVRSSGADKSDQKRTGTPKQAMQDGASMIVVGRQIRDAPDPRQAAMDILAEIEA